jgi:adenosylcobinamide-GDP ribazoletransferase
MTVTALTGRYARTHGLASSFLSERAPEDDAARRTAAPRDAVEGDAAPDASPGGRTARTTGASWVPPAAIGALAAIGPAVLDDPGSGVAVVAAGAAAAGVAMLARRRIGGFTGDTLGAGGVVAETVGLLIAVAVLRP